jgi:uncharacterized protein
MNRLLIVAAFALTCLAPATASAQSFACNKAKVATERLICSDKTVGVWDQVNAHLFYLVREEVSGSDRSTFLKIERQWLAFRNDCKRNVDCTLGAYRLHVSYLCKLIDELGIEPTQISEQACPMVGDLDDIADELDTLMSEMEMD